MPPGPSDPDDWVMHKRVLVHGPGLNSQFNPDVRRGVRKKAREHVSHHAPPKRLALPSAALVARLELPSVAPVYTMTRWRASSRKRCAGTKVMHSL